MRVLCVGRHPYLSEHLCRYFGELGAECEWVVGTASAADLARRYEPHVVVCDSELLTSPVLESWSHEPAIAGSPLLAVSLTRRPEERGSIATSTGVIYLPTLRREQALALLAGAYRPLGVQAPLDWRSVRPAAVPAPH